MHVALANAGNCPPDTKLNSIVSLDNFSQAKTMDQQQLLIVKILFVIFQNGIKSTDEEEERRSQDEEEPEEGEGQASSVNAMLSP